MVMPYSSQVSHGSAIVTQRNDNIATDDNRFPRSPMAFPWSPIAFVMVARGMVMFARGMATVDSGVAVDGHGRRWHCHG